MPFYYSFILIFLISFQVQAQTVAEIKNRDVPAINFGNVEVSPSLPVGSYISEYSTSKEFFLFDFFISDIFRSADIKSFLQSTGAILNTIDGNAVFKTNIDGLGVIFQARASKFSGTSFGPYKSLISNSAVELNTLRVTTNGVGTVRAQVRARLVKTGEILTGGPIINNNAFLFGKVFFHGGSTTGTNSPITLQGTLVPPSCTASISNLTVALDNFSSSEFVSVGSTKGVIGIPISLQCQKGANIELSVTGLEDSANSELGLLAIDQDSDSATGLALQILENGTSFPLNQKKLLRTSDEGGSEEFNLQVRYYQSAPVVTGGKVNALATFSFTYH